MVLDRFKSAGSRFAFELALEFFHDSIVDSLSKWLERYSDEDLRKMIVEHRYPPLEVAFKELERFSKYLDDISEIRLVEEFLLPARPSLNQIFEQVGEQSAVYLVDLRAYLIERIKHPVEESLAKAMATATCDKCNKSWPVEKAEFNNIKECPFCHAGAES
jgi:Zn finger protein HypA/HybF involved in hydrogenase expression